MWLHHFIWAVHSLATLSSNFLLHLSAWLKPKTLPSFSCPSAFSCLVLLMIKPSYSSFLYWILGPVCLSPSLLFLSVAPKGNLAKKLSSKMKGSNEWKWSAKTLLCSLLIYVFKKNLWIFFKKSKSGNVVENSLWHQHTLLRRHLWWLHPSKMWLVW